MSREADIAALRSMTGKRFWRALDELVDQPDFRARMGAAFPALASGPSNWRRRDILKCLGGAIALAGLDGCERAPDEEAMPFVEQPEGIEPGIARFYATAVEMDGVAQPVIGKTREGRPVKLEGNGDHPASRGATDAFTQAALLDLYDPARSAAPLYKRQPTSWARFDAALAVLRQELDGRQGAGFRLVTGPVGSPTLRRQIAALLDRWPQARWHVHAPVGGAGAGERLHLDRAHSIVSFDADLLGPGPRQLWHATGWGARRRAFQAGEGEASLFVAEPSPTITGVTATGRLAAAAARMGTLMNALAMELGVRAGPPLRLGSTERDWVERAAAALKRNAGRGLVFAGREQPPALHALARAIDRQLGNLGATRTFVVPAAGPPALDMAMLAEDIGAGAVHSLFLLDVNPCYSAPGLAPLLARVPMRIHAGLHADESAAAAHWHLPMPHLLESWSDGRAADGSAVLVQPLVRPWLDVRSRHALLEGLTGGDQADRDVVRETWADTLDEEGWTRALVGGIISGGEVAEGSPPEAGPPAAQPISIADGLSLLIRPDPTVWDGRFASNPWLQELPKPLTKITWGNAVHVSPALARERGLASGDRVRLSVGNRSVTGPVWILPGQERRTVLVHLGHGRSRGGPVAQKVGFDAYPLVDAQGEIRLEKIDGWEEVATTQHHFAMEGDEFIRFVDTLADALPLEPPRANFFSAQKSSPAWGMAIDLDLCIGCNACVVACVAENNIPMVGKEQVAKGREMHWLRVDRYYEGLPDDPQHAFQPVPCMHCEDAPCEMGCPVNAAVHSPDGLNLQVYNRCIGTRTCSAYCPYKVRRFNWFDLTAKDPPELRAVRNPEVSVRGRGVMEKCTYCIQRISAARISAKKEDRAIRDGEVMTACQAACPTQAIVFGDIADGESKVSRRKANARDYDLLPETNTRPRTTYQARIRGGEGKA